MFAAESLKVETERINLVADNGMMAALTCEMTKKHLVIFKKKITTLRLIDRNGVIRLQKRNATVRECTSNEWKSTVKQLIDDHTIHGDAGAEIPNIYVIMGSRIIDLAGMQSENQIMSLCQVELSGVQANEKLIVICTMTTENERG